MKTAGPTVETSSSVIQAGTAPGESVVLRDIVMKYGRVSVLDGFDLTVDPGEFVTLLGPSGSGKSTILKLIAGFESQTRGSIHIGERDVSFAAPRERGVGVVLQNYALFPHMTVSQNVGYGLKMRGWSARRRAHRVEEMLELVGLTGLADRLPRQLSGGQQQRVAMARALAFDPGVLLMDEPLGALDRELRMQMTVELRRIHRELRTTIIFVTHDRDEALTMSDRIALMRGGEIVDMDSPKDLYVEPRSSFAARFFGGHNVLRGVAEGGSTDATFDSEAYVTVRIGSTSLDVVGCSKICEGEEVEVIIPKRCISIGAPKLADAIEVQAQLKDLAFLGDSYQVKCHLDGIGEVTASVPYPSELPFTPGERTSVFLETAGIRAVPAGPQRH